MHFGQAQATIMSFVFSLLYISMQLCGCGSNSPPIPDPQAVMSVLDFGAACDGKTLDTSAFEKAMHVARNANFAVRINIPAGRICVTAPFNLTDRTTLYLESGSILRATGKRELWPFIPPLPTMGKAVESPGWRRAAFIGLYSLSGASIDGDGVIDGQGQYWWGVAGTDTPGHLIEVHTCNAITIKNVQLVNSPFWTTHIVYSRRVLVKGVNISAPHSSPNTDGVDVDSSVNVTIEDSYISTGDDCVAIKSGWDCFGIRAGLPSENVLVKNLTCGGASGGLVIGSDMSGGVANVTLVDSTFDNVGLSAVEVRTSNIRGGYVRGLTARNIVILNGCSVCERVHCALPCGLLDIHADYPWGKNSACPQPEAKHLPIIQDIRFEQISGYTNAVVGTGALNAAVRIVGLDGAPVRNVVITDVHLNAGPWSCSLLEFDTMIVSNSSPPACSAPPQAKDKVNSVHASQASYKAAAAWHAIV